METVLPKQFLELNGRPLLAWTLANLLKVGLLNELIVVVAPEMLNSSTLQKCLPETAVSIKVVTGGTHRQDSVFNGLKALTPQAEIVLVHDGVRPFADPRLIEETIRLCDQFDGAALAVPAVDTLKEVVNDTIVRTIDRTYVWQMQTPQTFRRKILEQAYLNAFSKSLIATDDSFLVEMVGGKVAVVASTPSNFKITCQNDLKLAKFMLECDE